MEYVRLDDVCNINMGQSPDSSSYNEENRGIPFFQGNADFGEKYPSIRLWCNDPIKIASINDILISVRAPIGALNYANTKCCIGRGLASITPNKNYISEYVFFLLKSKKNELNNLGTGSTFKAISKKILENVKVPVISIYEQRIIVHKLEILTEIINKKNQQLNLLDELIRARFVEMFGDPVVNSKQLPTSKMEERYFLKAGITTAANVIHDFKHGEYEVPCYGGNGIRGYVKEKSYEGDYPIIGRQGALCGNVQYVSGEFHATEHAVLVSMLNDDNPIWTYYLLKLMDLYRYHTGAAQPGLSVKILNSINIITASREVQNQFADFVKQVDKSKFMNLI